MVITESSGHSQDLRDLALFPGSYVYLQDETKGALKVYVGPTKVNQTGQERPIKFDPSTMRFQESKLEHAVSHAPCASDGDYIILDNPADIDGGDQHPPAGTTAASVPPLRMGFKQNIPGPCEIALWPGQRAQVVNGHNLRSNQYLKVRVYNEEEARKNWSRTIVKKAEDKKDDEKSNVKLSTTFSEGEAEKLMMGQVLVITGEDVSFYIPPTGVEVIAVGEERGTRNTYVDTAQEVTHVREAVTLERLEYCILIDENGNKRYERGPQVVFPSPTEEFLVEGGARKFRAIELGGKIQGVHIKVIAPYKDGEKEYKEGDELFLTGLETPIYFPQQEHSIISYGEGKNQKHYATAIPPGEGKYVLNRESGDIDTINGPTMYLPDPRTYVFIRRVLSDKEVELWYPGNKEALAYNQGIRRLMGDEPSGASGFVSDEDIRRRKIGVRSRSTPSAIADSGSEREIVGEAVTEAFHRGTKYTQPRQITLSETKYQGVPVISPYTGFAVQVVDRRGNRRVEVGPTSVLLKYDETLEILQMSTGKPKTTDTLERTVYLRVSNNKVSDIVRVHTSDHVPIDLKLSYRVNFEGDKNKWFNIENYVKFLCDHIRSMLKGAVRKLSIEEFWTQYVDRVRDIILGDHAKEGGKRPGLFFTENNMRVEDVEVLGFEIADQQVSDMLERTQRNAVASNIQLAESKRELEATQEQERVAQEKANAQQVTFKLHKQLEEEKIATELKLSLSLIDSNMQKALQNGELTKIQEASNDISHQAKLARAKADNDQILSLEKARQELKTSLLKSEAQSVVERFKAAEGTFAQAVTILGEQRTLQIVAESLSVQNLLGGKNFAEVFKSVFGDTPWGKRITSAIDSSQIPADLLAERGNGDPSVKRNPASSDS